MRGDMVATTVEDDVQGLRFLHPRIEVPTYPWEWTQSQWVAAAALTLKLCDEALDDGLILKDATPLNILFDGYRPVMVDVLSFEPRNPASAIWLAYGQYIRTFLLPLIVHRALGWPLALSFFKRDGYEPADLYQAMGWSQRLSRTAFWPVTVPSWLERRGDDKAAAAAFAKPQRRAMDPDAATHLLRRTLSGLRARTERAIPRPKASNWSGYQANLSHYTAEQGVSKHDWVRSVFADVAPKRVLDIGANTGEYSALAVECGATVVALERDQASADRLYVASRERDLAIQTIHCDLARPSPPAGWENEETSGLLPRLEGRFDMVMMLAVIHHLILMEQIPLGNILALMARLTTQFLIVEWVPASDPMYQSLMRGRDDLYGSLTEADLLRACDGRFRLMRQMTLGNGRMLFLFEKTLNA